MNWNGRDFSNTGLKFLNSLAFWQVINLNKFFCCHEKYLLARVENCSDWNSRQLPEGLIRILLWKLMYQNSPRITCIGLRNHIWKKFSTALSHLNLASLICQDNCKLHLPQCFWDRKGILHQLIDKLSPIYNKSVIWKIKLLRNHFSFISMVVMKNTKISHFFSFILVFNTWWLLQKNYHVGWFNAIWEILGIMLNFFINSETKKPKKERLALYLVMLHTE